MKCKMLLRALPNKSILRHYATKLDVLGVLRERGLIAQVSEPRSLLERKLERGEKIKLYCGADPTAKSLHLGNLLPLMVLLHFYVCGHDIVTLVGGATGMVGDPSGRKTERDALLDATRLDNISRINKQFSNFFRNAVNSYKQKFPDSEVNNGSCAHVNNYDWWQNVKMLDFLANYGKHIRIQSMLVRDSISSRLEARDGLGFNEFTYQILQAYDFYHLYENEDVTVQIGGNDQWGNITAGIDLIGRIATNTKNPPFGITVPLLTTSTGEKFGKSAGNAVFIDPEINTPYDMYQFFVNTTDADVGRFMKIFTFIPLDEIEHAVSSHLQCPHLRQGQRLLAREVVNLVHGPGKGDDAEMVSDVLFGRNCSGITGDELVRVFREAGVLLECSRHSTLTEILIELAQCSKSEAKRRIKQGSIYLGPERTKVVDEVSSLDPYVIDGKVLILRFGKQKCFVLKLC